MNNTSTVADLPVGEAAAPNQWLVIGASSLGTVFEWYDFYIYGLLATILTTQFFSGVNEVTGFIFALATFAAGFAVRPFGALLFGRSTWQLFSKLYPGRSDPFSTQLNTAPKWVASRTLDDVSAWNNSRLLEG